jgi:methionine-rich copper-binding protein CopC
MLSGHRVRQFHGVILLCAMLLVAKSAFAHAILLEAVPAGNSKVSGPNVPIKLRYNVRIDKDRSRLIMVSPGGTQQTLVIEKESPVDTLASEAKGLAAGEYRLRWQVLASDGHITRGEVLFSVTKA